MSPLPASRTAGTPHPYPSVAGRIARATQQSIAAEYSHGIVQGARAGAVDFVAGRALQAVESLTNLEGMAIRRNPLGEARYRAIVDTATASLAHIVAETGRGW